MCNNVIQGIVSYGQKNGTSPRAYTKVSRFLSWIKKTMKKLKLQELDCVFFFELIHNHTVGGRGGEGAGLGRWCQKPNKCLLAEWEELVSYLFVDPNSRQQFYK